MHALVTGGCGFIGSHLVDRLVVDGHGVTVLDNLVTGTREHLNAAATLVEGDVADAALVTSLAAEVDAVFHLAAIASVEACEADLMNAHRTNFTGSVTVFEAAAAAAIPVVYASSAAVYGDNPHLPLAESAQTQPLGKYGADKLAAEQAAARLAATQGLHATGLRFFNVYGPRQNPASPYSGVISKFTAHAQAGQPLTFFGDGEQTRDFIHVTDIVALLLAALAHTNGAQVFNGCTGRTVSLKQLAASIGEALGVTPVTTHAAARAGDIRHSCGDPSRAAAELGFMASVGLAEGLGSLVAAHA